MFRVPFGCFCTLVVIFLSVSVAGFPKLYEALPEQPAPYRLYTRTEWGAAKPENVISLKTPVPYVVLHHTYIPEACNTTAQCMRSMRSMQNYHNSLGWGDIGYHFCIGNAGDAYEGRGWDVLGIHASRANNFSVGICLIGDWRTVRPPQVMLDTAKSLIATGVSLGAVSKNYKLIGHDQVSATECPGAAFTKEFSTWKHYDPAPFPANTDDLKLEHNANMI